MRYKQQVIIWQQTINERLYRHFTVFFCQSKSQRYEKNIPHFSSQLSKKFIFLRDDAILSVIQNISSYNTFLKIYLPLNKNIGQPHQNFYFM